MRLTSLVVFCTAASMAAACSRGGEEAAVGGGTVAVTTVAAEPGTIAAILQASGVVSPAPGAEQIVTAPEPARIVELPKAEGETVLKDDVLVRFQFETDVLDAERDNANLAAAEARLANARAAHARAKELFDRGLAPRINVETAQTQITAAEAEVRAVREATSGMEAGRSNRAVVRAAFDGVIERRMKSVGETVDGATSAVLVVVDPNRLEVTAQLPYSEARRINVGNAARMMTAEDAPAASLTVVARPDMPGDQAATVTLRLAFDAPPAMPVGAPVLLRIVAEVHEGATLVPLAAVVYDGDAASVYVVSNNKVQRVPVTVGITNDTHAEITSGVEPGAMVAIESDSDLFDGAKVTVR